MRKKRVRNMRVKLEINKDNFNEPIRVGSPPHDLTKSQILNILFAAYPQRKAFLKNKTYKLQIPIDPKNPNSPKIKIELKLKNDIIYRPSTGSQKLRPDVIFRPVMVNGVRTIKPHIIYRSYSSEKDEARYSVLDSQIDISKFGEGEKLKGALGQGKFGVVVPVLGTLAEQREGWIFKTHKERVIKVQKGESKEEVTKEYNFLVQTGHLDTKEVMDENEKTFIVQKRGKVSLWDFLIEEKKNELKLTIDQRYQLSINILRALKEQIHDRGVVSRDIKPQNILIDPDTLEVKIIDLGFAKNIIDQSDRRAMGTPVYIAPDKFDGAVDERSDWFEIGIVLSELWGKLNEKKTLVELLEERKHLRSGPNLDELFKNLKLEEQIDSQMKLDDQHKKEISDIVTQLTDGDRVTRMSIDVAITRLEQERISWNTLNIEDVLAKENIKKAFTSGQALREKLKVLSNSKEYLIENLEQAIKQANQDQNSLNPDQLKSLEKAKIAYDALIYVTNEFEKIISSGGRITEDLRIKLEKAIQESEKNLIQLNISLNIPMTTQKEINNEIFQSLETIEDNPVAIKFFVEALGFNCLKGLDTKEAIQNKINTITTTMDDNLKILHGTITNLEKDEAITPKIKSQKKELHSEITKNIDKYEKRMLDLDRLSLLNDACSERIKQIEKVAIVLVNNDFLKEVEERRKNLFLEQAKLANTLRAFSKIKNSTIKAIIQDLNQFNETLNNQLAEYKKLESNENLHEGIIQQFNEQNEKADFLIKQINEQFSNLDNVDILKPVIDLRNEIETIKKQLKKEDDSDLKNQKLQILSIIEDYMNETLTAKNIDNKDRIASGNRQNDVRKLLEIINNKDPALDFKSQIESALHGMTSGIEQTTKFGIVFSILNKKMENFKYSAVGGLFFKSELRSRIKEKLDENKQASPVKKALND